MARAKPQYSLLSKLYAVGLGLAGWGALLWSLQLYPLRPDQWLYVVLLGVVGVSLSAIGTTLPNTTTYVSTEAVAYYAAILGVNPAAAALVALLPTFRWRIATATANNWAAFRNSGQYI